MASAPLMLGVSSASATGGCQVNNFATSSSSKVTVVVNPLADPPVVITFDSTSTHCSYVSGGGVVNYGCTLAGGRCTIYVNGSAQRACTGYANTTCGSFFMAQEGDTITLEVIGGSGFVMDAV